MPGAYQIDYWVIFSPPGGSIEGFSGVLGRFEPFFSRLEPNFSRKSPNLCTFQISQMSNFNRGKIVKRGATVRVPMIARGPVVRHPVDPIICKVCRLFLTFFRSVLTFFSAIFDLFSAIFDVFSISFDLFFGYF